MQLSRSAGCSATPSACPSHSLLRSLCGKILSFSPQTQGALGLLGGLQASPEGLAAAQLILAHSQARSGKIGLCPIETGTIPTWAPYQLRGTLDCTGPQATGTLADGREAKACTLEPAIPRRENCEGHPRAGKTPVQDTLLLSTPSHANVQ